MVALARDAGAASIVVIVGIFTYKFGLVIGSLIGVVSTLVFIFSGIGRITLPTQSYEITKNRKPKQTAPRMKIGFKETAKVPSPGVNTLYDNFQHGVKKSGDNPCLAWIPDGKSEYVSQSYNEVNTRIENFGKGLYDLGLKPSERVGFYAKNKPEWVIGAEACNAFSLVSVAIYDTLGEENREFIIEQSEIIAICTTNNLVQNVCDAKPACPKLKFVIVMEGIDENSKKAAKAAGIEAFSFTDIEEKGEKSDAKPVRPKPDDLAILMYTSGTTSRPKGVMISHRNLIACIAGICDVIPNFNEKDRFFSYLPLAHILERAAEAAMFYSGCAVGFFRGDIRKITEDVSTWKPTIYAGVPKVYQRIMNVVKAKLAHKPKPVQAIFWFAFNLRARLIELGVPTGIFDKTIFKEVRGGLGGNVRFIVSGGAPLGKECHKFMRVCFGCPAVQGYGLTETCGGVSAGPADMTDPWEKAGVPFSCTQVKLVDGGKYSTSANPPEGEICVKGDNIALGYYKNPEKTAEVFVEEDDGIWFHTGDVGRWNSDGTFSIIGRVKDIFKLDGGEYIAPERLETIYGQSRFLSNIFVYGSSDKANVVAIAVPDAAFAKNWANKNGVKFTDVPEPNTPSEICKNKDFIAAVKQDLDAMAKEAKLNNYEYIPAIYLDGTFWTADTGLVTDAMKNKRDPLYDHFKKEIEALYNKK